MTLRQIIRLLDSIETLSLYIIFKINNLCLYDRTRPCSNVYQTVVLDSCEILCEQQHLSIHGQWSNAFSVSNNTFEFSMKLASVSHITHQQCKDSVSVFNPLESPAAFLCLKHNVRLRPMHGAGKSN